MSSDSAVSSPGEGQPAAAGPDVLVCVRDAGKCYHLYPSPLHRLKQAAARTRKQYYREFWALRGVSFDLARGEAMGIIGLNGSGKSTLLRIIAGTLAPTTGTVRVRGRVAAILELGSGFDPEFTGRDNVFLNGAILGISRAEMQRRFDQIAGFADIGDFMDQPIKTYSSGMRARLGFAVASSVSPDVLIVDEALAVGDSSFQMRCIARIGQLLDEGVSLLFVSHAMSMVTGVCHRGLFLDRGKTVFLGAADEAADRYLHHSRETKAAGQLAAARRKKAPPDGPAPAGSAPEPLRSGSGEVEITEVELLDADGRPHRSFRCGDGVTVRVTVRAHARAERVGIGFAVRDWSGVDLFGTFSCDEGRAIHDLDDGDEVTATFTFVNTLHVGRFGVSASVAPVATRYSTDHLPYDSLQACAAFEVTADPKRPVFNRLYVPVKAAVAISRRAEVRQTNAID